MIENDLCPCGSGKNIDECCGQYFHKGVFAPTAEALMRSRYTAYVMGKEAYLLETWHEKNRPASLNLDKSLIQWQGLSIIRTEAGMAGDLQGIVEFSAAYRDAGRLAKIHEVSRFVKVGDCWLYVDGDLISSGKTARNAPCPCGSGRKYKRCCGQS